MKTINHIVTGDVLKIGDYYYVKACLNLCENHNGNVTVELFDDETMRSREIKVKPERLHYLTEQQESNTSIDERLNMMDYAIECLVDRMEKLEPDPEHEIEVGDLVEVVDVDDDEEIYYEVGDKFVVRLKRKEDEEYCKPNLAAPGIFTRNLKLIRKAADLD